MIRKQVAGLSLSCWVACWPHHVRAQHGATNGEWRTYGGDLGSTKYSPLDQIDETNFDDLEIAWRWQSVDGRLDLDALRETQPAIGIRNLKATPLMVDGVLYLSTPLYQAAAIDAATGETLWVHDPRALSASCLRTRTSVSGSTRGVLPTGPTDRISGCCGEQTKATCLPSTPGQASRYPSSATTAGSISWMASLAPTARRATIAGTAGSVSRLRRSSPGMSW